MALAAAVAAANLYYCQPLLSQIARSLHMTARESADIPMLTQVGYAVVCAARLYGRAARTRDGSAADRDSIASWDLICSRCLGADGNLANEWDVQRGAASSLWCADGGTFTILPHGHVTVLKKTSIWSCVGSSDQGRQRKAAPQSKPLARSGCTTSKFGCKP